MLIEETEAVALLTYSSTRLLTIDLTSCSCNTCQDVIRLCVIERVTYTNLLDIGELAGQFAGIVPFICVLHVVIEISQPLVIGTILAVIKVVADLRYFVGCFELAIDANCWLCCWLK